MLIVLFFVETRGLSLEEIPALFDGPKALATPQNGSYVQDDDEHKDGKAASEEHLEVARRSV